MMDFNEKAKGTREPLVREALINNGGGLLRFSMPPGPVEHDVTGRVTFPMPK